MQRKTVVKGILWFFTGMAVMVAIARFSRGLGATTNLTDSNPWGFWIGFDVMAGVALAAGGFVTAAVVYIFRMEKFHGLARPAVLTAFLGYLAVAIGLTFDLGLPWNIWHPMIYWQHRSVLFEVATCVILYLNVLALEFAPVALEHKLAQWPLLQKIYKLLKTLTIPLVILGIMLSTLHQSSLGSLFVIMPYRVHPLWYSPGLMLPLNFFVSAVALGFMMVTFEHFVSAWIYKHKPHTHLLSTFGGLAAIVLGLYAVLRVGDLFARGILPGALDGSWQSWLFLFEIGVSAVIPALLLATPKMRQNSRALFAAAAMVVFGMVLYRLDIAIVTMKRWPGTSYFPSLVEIMVSVGVVSGLALVFMYFVENLSVFEESMKLGEKRAVETAEEALAAVPEGKRPPRGVVTGTIGKFTKLWFANEEPFQKPRFSPTTKVWLGNALHADFRSYSMIFILAIALTAAVLPEPALFGFVAEPLPVESARAQVSEKGELLTVNGNRALESVTFNHDEHKKLTGGEQGCMKCHHMNLPESEASSCSACHSDMYRSASAFDHKRHQDRQGGNDGCVKCHESDKDPMNAKSCVACHQEMYPGKAETERVNYIAPSYKDAMHGKCVACHEEEAVKQNKPGLGLCASCHPNER